MQISDLRQNLLIQKGQELYKVSTVYDHRFTAELVLYREADGSRCIPPRTTVCSFNETDLAGFTEPSQQIVNHYEDAWGFDRR